MTLKEAVELQKEPLLQSLAESIRIRSVQEPPADGAHTAPMSANALTTPWLCQRDSVSAPLILITRWDGVNSVKAMR